MVPSLDDWFRAAYPLRGSEWQLRTRSVDCRGLPRLMGIVNVTPDSFSDGGRFLSPQQAVDHALRLEDAGADLLDVGGESTRPYADPVTTDEELRRVIPVLEGLLPRVAIPLSIDTSKAAVATAAVQLGVEVINDVTALAGDPEMLPLAVGSRVGVCAMHMRGTPRTMQEMPHYKNVVTEIHGYLHERREALLAAGIDRSRICLDPGIGFGKTHQHNLELMSRCERFHDLGCPLLVGYSRKGFLGKLLGDAQLDRLAVGIGAGLSLARQGVQILRVHDVGPLRQALLGFVACGGIDGSAGQLSH
jgi:dihydropteroate synthase